MQLFLTYLIIDKLCLRYSLITNFRAFILHSFAFRVFFFSNANTIADFYYYYYFVRSTYCYDIPCPIKMLIDGFTFSVLIQ